MEKLEPLLDRQMLRQLYSEEDQAYRARIWNSKFHDHVIQARLDRLHRQWVNEIRSSQAGNQIRSILTGLLNYSTGIELQLAHPCDHLTALYPLNRFLVHLIAAIAPSSVHISSETAVKKVICVDHEPKIAKDCIGKEHEVEFVPYPNCRSDGQQENTRGWKNTYDVVILRLGLPSTDEFNFRFSRHLLPYYPPL
jgi:hypothetical protein